MSWSITTSPSQNYQVRVRDGGNNEYARLPGPAGWSDVTTANLSAPDLRCLTEGENYHWLVRAYDSNNQNAQTVDTTADYSPTNLVRTELVYAMAWNGRLNLSAAVRPGSRQLLDHIDITGPNGFSYTIPAAGHTLDDYWWNPSTETQLGVHEWDTLEVTDAPPLTSNSYGDYTFYLEL